MQVILWQTFYPQDNYWTRHKLSGKNYVQTNSSNKVGIQLNLFMVHNSLLLLNSTCVPPPFSPTLPSLSYTYYPT